MTDRDSSTGNKIQLIRDLCNQWMNTPGTGHDFHVSGRAEKYRLLASGIDFRHLTYLELREACICLTLILLQPSVPAGKKTLVESDDHRYFWAWCAELLAGKHLNGYSPFFPNEEEEIRDLLGLTYHAATAVSSVHVDSSTHVDHSVMNLVMRRQTLTAYLGFPLLEAILKKAAHRYVDLNGKVLQPFQKGVSGTYGTGDSCSRLLHLLWLAYGTVGSPELKSALDEIRVHLSGFSNANEDPFALVKRWRNSSLHGSTSIELIGGTVLMLAFLVALDCVAREFDFDSMRKEADDSVKQMEDMAARGGTKRTPWNFYPPEGSYTVYAKG